jgi:probable phosphoglycerate mutase
VTKILLVRHGHVEGITPARFRGRADLPLTATGRLQADRVAQRITSCWKPRVVYTSPLARCVMTAAAIASACAIPSATLDDLIDIDYGAWQFKSLEEAERENPRLLAAWLATPHLVRFPGGDSLQDLVARTSNALRHVLDRHGDDTVVMVGHDNVNRALLLQLVDQPLSSYWRLAQSPCCINEIDIEDGRITVARLNEMQHLEGATTG